MSTENIEFKKDQKIVYPSQGVGTIIDIVDKPFRGQGAQAGQIVKHYKIYIEVSDMTIFIPVQSAEIIGIRAIVSAEEAQKALELLSIDTGPITSDWKLRYQQNLDLLKKGNVDDIANIVRCLYQRSKVKELPIQERKLYDSATKLLIDEISIALGKSAEEVDNMIHSKLEPLGAAVSKKVVQSSFDDEDDDDEFAEDETNDSDNEDESDDDSDDADSDADSEGDDSDEDDE